MSNITVLYHPNTDHEPLIRDLTFNYKRQTNKDLNTLSLETVEGAEMAKLYDITRYPAIVARRQDGELLKTWEGEPLPLINEISYYDEDRTRQSR